MNFNSIFLVLYDCPGIFERLVGRTCYLSDTEELIAHATIVGILFVVFGVLLFILRHRRLSKK